MGMGMCDPRTVPPADTLGLADGPGEGEEGSRWWRLGRCKSDARDPVSRACGDDARAALLEKPKSEDLSWGICLDGL